MRSFQLAKILKFVCVTLLLVVASGCEEELEHYYGEETGKSVNGTGVFAEMFRHAGYKVQTRRTLRPALMRNTDVIVWFPDDFSPPNVKQTEWFQRWLEGKSGRTLIYVGRDYDCEPDYWTEVQTRKLSNDPTRVATKLGNAKLRVQYELSSQKLPIQHTWFEKDTLTPPANPTSISGAWSANVNFSKCNLQTNSELQNASSLTNDLLVVKVNGKQQPFVFEELVPVNTYNQHSNWANTGLQTNRRIIINNGSFLLNFALVNKEHRVLANTLIQSLQGANVVTFLESDYGGPIVYDSDTYSSQTNGWELFKVQPLGWILLHLAIVGIVFCFVRWPIFGRTRELKSSSLQDYSQHFKAIALLLRRAKNPGLAEQRVAHFQAMQRELKRRGIVNMQ